MKRGSQYRHPRIEEAALLPWVVILCCHRHRIGLSETDIELAVYDLLRAEGWHASPVVAEVVNSKRRAPVGTLDGVALEPTGFKDAYRPRPWLLEAKRGDRDLTAAQLQTVKDAPKWGCRVLIFDEASLVRDFLKERK